MYLAPAVRMLPGLFFWPCTMAGQSIRARSSDARALRLSARSRANARAAPTWPLRACNIRANSAGRCRFSLGYRAEAG
jgi:hypothetical protein